MCWIRSSGSMMCSVTSIEFFRGDGMDGESIREFWGCTLPNDQLWNGALTLRLEEDAVDVTDEVRLRAAPNRAESDGRDSRCSHDDDDTEEADDDTECLLVPFPMPPPPRLKYDDTECLILSKDLVVPLLTLPPLP
jgi:hypothetical protein